MAAKKTIKAKPAEDDLEAIRRMFTGEVGGLQIVSRKLAPAPKPPLHKLRPEVLHKLAFGVAEPAKLESEIKPKSGNLGSFLDQILAIFERPEQKLEIPPKVEDVVEGNIPEEPHSELATSGKKTYFITFEGIRGAGCDTQSKLLARWLSGRGKRVLNLNYPDGNDPYGKLAIAHLGRKINLPQDRLFMAHFQNQLKDSSRIRKKLQEGSFVVANRYFGSNLAHNCQPHLVDTAIKMAVNFKMQKPDLVFYLNTAPEVSVKRSRGDLNKRREVNESYRKLAKRNKFGQWITINGNAPVHQVRTKVLESLWPYLK